MHADLSSAVYIARLGSLFGYMVVLGCVVAMLPIGRIGTLAILSTPTAIHLASCYSADPMTNTIAALFTAWCLRLRLTGSAEFETHHKALFVLLGIAVGLLKLTCGLFGVFALLIPLRYFRTPSRAWAFRFLALFACVGAALAWNLSYPFVPGPYWNSGADPSLAAHMLMSRPLHEAGVILGNVRDHGYFWWVDGYSRFCTGPMPFYFLFNGGAAAMGLAVVWVLAPAENGSPSLPMLACLFLVMAAVYMLEVLIAFKIGFSPPWQRDIAGLQGRYFLLPLALAYLGVVLALPARIGFRPAVAPLLGVYLMLTIHVMIALLGAYAPEWF